MFKKIKKQNGSVVEFYADKISHSIWLAAQRVGGHDEELAKELGEKVVTYLSEKYTSNKDLSTEDIGQAVEKVLIEGGYAKTAKEYILYRENKKHTRQDKSSLGVVDDIGLSYNTLYILKKRYLKKDKNGAVAETPKQMFERVATFLSRAEKTEKEKDRWRQRFFEVMVSFEFTPGSRTLANAGKSKAQLANCFVWPIKDDIDSIFDILHKSTLIKKNGGGCGYNFSNIRPEGDFVGETPNLAAGPVKIMQSFDLMTSLFKQEGQYESGNMAILNCDHPDIFNFITAKQNDGTLSKTNLSVGITDEFMEAAISGKNWSLVNPRTGEVVQVVSARSILDLMANSAWQTGDPGIVNLSAMNRGTALSNPLLKRRGVVSATNPCGEVPLFPFESCNLGYINFTKFIKQDDRKKNTFDFEKLKNLMPTAVRLMDNVIEASWFPVKEVSEAVKGHRRIGIGCVGWAETLALLDVPYDSEEAFELAEKVTKTMYQSAFSASISLAKEKGPFPLIGDSIWANSKEKPRNVALLTFPPSSTNAVLCETSFGVEPFFALAYEQNVLGGMRLKSMNQLLLKKLKERDVDTDLAMQKILDNHGSAQGIAEIPQDLQKLFKTAHDIDWKSHIKMQAAFQKWTDNAITKTINMPSSATAQDVKDAYIMAWKLGCKGLTVYRDKSKQNQVFEFGYKKESNGQNQLTRKCPDCGKELIREKNCLKCKSCGFSVCEL